jgi:WxL Interacting Protein, peptidoglycan binding domain
MRMRIRHLAPVFLAVIGATTTAASADVSGLGVAPAHADPADPATRSYFVNTVAPGGSVSDQVRVTNGGDATLHLDVSAVDGLTGATSGAVYGNREDPIQRWGAWLSPAVSTLTMPPHSSTLVDVAVHVPGNATPGDHLAGIAVEDARPATSGGSLEVTTVVRTVVGVLVKVPGPAAFHLTVSGASLEPFDEQMHLATVSIELTDDGRLLGKPAVTVDLSGPNGYHRTAMRQLDTILPGDSIAFPFPWPDTLQPGDYTLAVSAAGPGMDAPSRWSGVAHLGAVLQGMATPAPAAASRAVQPPPASWPLWLLIPAIVGLVLLTAILALLVILLRRRPAAPDGGQAA